MAILGSFGGRGIGHKHLINTPAGPPHPCSTCRALIYTAVDEGLTVRAWAAPLMAGHEPALHAAGIHTYELTTGTELWRRDHHRLTTPLPAGHTIHAAHHCRR